MKMTDQINTKLAYLGKLLFVACNEEQAKEMGQTKYLSIDENSSYGGFRLVLEEVGSYAHYPALGYNDTAPRVKGPEMLARLDGMIRLIEHFKTSSDFQVHTIEGLFNIDADNQDGDDDQVIKVCDLSTIQKAFLGL